MTPQCHRQLLSAHQDPSSWKFEGSHDFGLHLDEEVLDRSWVANYMSSKPALSLLAPALTISNWLTTSPVSLRERRPDHPR